MKIKWFLLLILVIVLSVSYYRITKKYNFNEPIIFNIKKGSNHKEILKTLKNYNIISNIDLHLITFKLANFFKQNYHFKSGEYLVTNNDNYYKILQKLLTGGNHYHKVTFIEGITVDGVIKQLMKSGLVEDKKVDNIFLEGSLLPETYYISKDTGITEHLLLMSKAMDKILSEAWRNRAANLPLKSKEELLILASIVEKETGLSGERDRVAGVFINRLRLNMKLQSDPTVIYAITKGKYKLERPLSKRDLRIKSPYNTYYADKLPPTPICNPGKAAILASANPAITKDLYFVSNGKGEHRFSKTLKEHNINVRKLRAYERSQK